MVLELKKIFRTGVVLFRQGEEEMSRACDLCELIVNWFAVV